MKRSVTEAKEAGSVNLSECETEVGLFFCHDRHIRRQIEEESCNMFQCTQRLLITSASQNTPSSGFWRKVSHRIVGP